MASPSYQYDVFVSHAVEDKISIANELADRLQKTGLKVWYSGNELIIGKSIEETINKGLAQSRFGIVILSPTYLSKDWTIREFYWLINQNKNTILPILHNITLKEIVDKYPFMADVYCIHSDKGMDYVVDAITTRIKGDTPEPKKRKLSHYLGVGMVALALSGTYPIYKQFQPARSSATPIETAIQNRIADFEKSVVKTSVDELTMAGATPSSTGKIDTLFTSYVNLKAHFRNEYEFFNGFTRVRFKKNVGPALRIEIDSLVPITHYKFNSPKVYLLDAPKGSASREVKYAFICPDAVTYSQKQVRYPDENTCLVTVAYDHYIRYIEVKLTFASNKEGTKKHQMAILGFLPEEEYVFHKTGDEWKLAEIK
ncbi:toll/interleukin-1 receptor domain-containing protein [Chryseolinea lacunae]|uniref:Toll/interleukin-1 receptor domain-containing protein n=1 Tax=Chryseolinea lacunae TaxID=2801331 RepID=A0ABS1KT42_9BACT|nr:toll/interleukin-1 receptor domain-containing protein [Chryseolinea lacunae]MBL0741456.1 toll/interleukin-1 receptor domain-containing protein [Chryseolinea lacunae]